MSVSLSDSMRSAVDMIDPFLNSEHRV